MRSNAQRLRVPEEILKHRDICFESLHPNPTQVQTAIDLLSGIEGIVDLSPGGKGCIRICYDLRYVTLEAIEHALVELGFHLDNSLMCRLKRALHHYTESNQRAHLGYHPEMNIAREVFINRYAQIRHGCRDQLPRYWREYL